MHLFYLNTNVTDSGEKSESGQLLMFPGDSISLNNNGRIVNYSTGFQNFIDSLITIPKTSPLPNLIKLNKELKTIGFSAMVSNINHNYKKNEQAIVNLKLNSKLTSCLENFNYLIHANAISNIPYEKLSNNDQKIADSVYGAMLAGIDKTEAINSGFSYNVFYNIIRYNAYRNGMPVKDFWSFFDKVDPRISGSSFYQPYAITLLKKVFDNKPDNLQYIVSKLKSIKNPINTVDTLRSLAHIFLTTKDDYMASKRSLNEYANGRFSHLLEDNDISHHQQRNISSLKPVNLIDFNYNKVVFQEALFTGNPKIIVLDFWASWCVPCIAEYPYLKKVKESLKNKPIKFIGISIDLEKDTSKWIARTKQLKTFNEADQFRLEDPKHSAINSYFNLYSVPRYIVIDRNGEILEEIFDRPDTADFQRKLKIYLSEL